MDREQPCLESRDLQISHSSSLSSGLGDSSSLQSFNRPPHSPALSLRSSTSRSSVSIPDASSAPPSRSHSNNNFRPGNAYVPSTVYQTRTTYRHQQYPTFSPNTNVRIDSSSSLHSTCPLDRPPSPTPFLHEPKIINHQILVEAPVRVASTATLTLLPPARSSSWDRSNTHHVEASGAPSITDCDTKCSTLDQRRSRGRPRYWQETTIDYHHRIPTPQAPRANNKQFSPSPSPLCYTAEVTKPYELTDYYKYSNRIRKISRTTPEEPDSGLGPCSPGALHDPKNHLFAAHAYPVSPTVTSNLVVCGNSVSGTASPCGGSSSSSRSDRTVSPKLQTSSQSYLPVRPMQCVPALPRSTREAQISWKDEAVPKTPTIV